MAPPMLARAHCWGPSFGPQAPSSDELLPICDSYNAESPKANASIVSSCESCIAIPLSTVQLSAGKVTGGRLSAVFRPRACRHRWSVRCLSRVFIYFIPFFWTKATISRLLQTPAESGNVTARYAVPMSIGSCGSASRQGQEVGADPGCTEFFALKRIEVLARLTFSTLIAGRLSNQGSLGALILVLDREGRHLTMRAFSPSWVWKKGARKRGPRVITRQTLGRVTTQ